MSAFGAFGLLQPLIENSSNAWGTGDAAREKQREDARYDYNQNELTGIQHRVEGAKAAGLHPLAALGFQAGSSPSIPVGADYSSIGRAFESMDKKGPTTDDEMRSAQLRLMSAQALDLETQALQRSTEAKARQPGNPPAYPTDPLNLPQGQGSSTSGIVIKPNEITSAPGGHTEAGIQPTQATGRGSDGRLYHGLSRWGLDQTEDMELLRLGVFAYLNRHNILDPLVQKTGVYDLLDKIRDMGLLPGKGRDARDAASFQKHEDTKEIIRLMNRSRARDRQR